MKKSDFIFFLLPVLMIFLSKSNSIPFRIICGAVSLLLTVDIIKTLRSAKYGNREA